MRLFIFILILSFLFSGYEILAQQTNFELIPQSGKKYIYQIEESTYLKTKDGDRINEFIKSKIFELEYKFSEQDNKKLLFVTVTENTARKPHEEPYMIRDYKYPEFRDGFYSNINKDGDFYEHLLCEGILKYEFNEGTSEVKLYNRDEILLKVRKILDIKGFSRILKDRRTEDFNTLAIPAITKKVQSLYHVNKDILNPQDYDTKLEIKNSVLRIANRSLDKTPGIYELNYSFNNEDRFLQEFQQTELDSVKRPLNVNGEYYHLIYTEQKVKLLNINEKEGTRLTVSGTLENQRNKKVTLAFMRKPYGTELYQETVFLDENNSFHIETEMKQAGLVFLILGQTSSTIPLLTIPLYAEPGSNIQLKAVGEFPREIEFSGDYSGAQRLLYNFNKQHNWLKQRVNFNSLSWWWLSEVNYNDLTNAIDNLDSFTKEYKQTMPEYVFEFVNNELKANLMCGVLRYLRNLEFQRRVSWGTLFLKDKDLINKDYLEEVLNATEIHEIYNPNGMFSRQFASIYLHYYFSTIKKVHNLDFASYNTAPLLSTDLRFYGDLPHKIEVAKTLLSGPALYAQIAEMLVLEKTRIYNQETKDITYRQSEVEKYLDLMFRLCNDDEFTQALKNVIDTQSQWDKKEYVPDTKFFNQKGEPRFMQDFLGKKPTVFYITSQWYRERYFFDELAEENPEINFVLIAEGSNITEWMDYTKRAEPLANQLFLINHEKQLATIFKSGKHHFIAYDKNGVRIGFHNNMVSAMNLCKQSLQPEKKKQLNKSQLQLIIVVLLIFLTALLIFILLWKWRVRQRFRKHEQHRKLKELELTAIRSQMNPHFLFNSLNSVQNLVQQNKGREAHLYLSDFAGLIRKVLNNSEKEEVSLAEELEMIKQYLNLEKLRFDFDFELHVDPELDKFNTLIPSMLLQPFVENAVIHGLHNSTGQRKLKVGIISDNGLIKIVIEDNGIGREAARDIQNQKNGKGTRMVKNRLEILKEQHGETYNCKTIDLKEGTRVELILPEEN